MGSTRRGRWLASVVGVACFFATTCAGMQPASAATAPLAAVPAQAAVPADTVVHSRKDAEGAISQPALDYFTSTYHVSEAVARERLASQVMVGDLPAQLEHRVGSGVAGAQFDDATGEWDIGVTPAADTAKVRSVLGDLGLGSVSRLHPQAVSDKQLDSEADRLVPRVAAMTGGTGAMLAVHDGQVHVQVSQDLGQSKLSTITSAVHAQAMSSSPALGSNVVVDPVPVVQVKPPPALACIYPYCDTLVAGIEMWTYQNDANPNTRISCTAGFWVGVPGLPRISMLTAGHCIQAIGQPWGTCSINPTNCYNVGSQVESYNGGTSPSTADGDAGLIKQDVAGFDAYAGYFNWTPDAVSPLHAYETQNPVRGEVDCKQGVTTRSTCGTIQAQYVNISPDASGRYYTGLFQSDACSQQGDSGGPWAQAAYETAVGLTSHGNYAGSCTPYPSYGEPIQRALTRFGAVVYGYN